MDQLTLYVAGPMTGLPAHNYPAFHAAADQLRAVGYAVVHPAVHDDTSLPWEFYMRTGIRGMLGCDGVATLPGWNGSRGATVEVGLARILRMPVRAVAQWAGAR